MKRKYDVRLSAVFIGKVPSLGFYPGKRYTGWLRHDTFISDEGPRCPYSPSGFLTFWTEIEILQRNLLETINRDVAVDVQ